MDDTQPKPDKQDWLQKIIPSWQALRGSGIGALVTGIATYLGVETNIVGDHAYPKVTASREAVAMAEWGQLTPEIACREQARASKSLNSYFQELGEKNGKTNREAALTAEECLQALKARPAPPNPQ